MWNKWEWSKLYNDKLCVSDSSSDILRGFKPQMRWADLNIR